MLSAWARCDLGHMHWGAHGAAGVAVVEGAAVLLQLRAPWTVHGRT